MPSLNVVCRFCEEEYDLLEDNIDRNKDGFWCDHCDGYTFLNSKNEELRKFTLILESKEEINDSITKLILPVRLNKRMSVLRYPGGKSKIAEYICSHIAPGRSKVLSSPYVGGGSVELALLEAGVVEGLELNDLDFGIYSLFYLIKFFPEALKLEIRTGTLKHKDFLQAQKIVKSEYAGCDLFEAAWSLLIVNRLSFSGIYKANALGGKKGNISTLLSRWNPEDLCRRIDRIHRLSDRINIYNEDALTFIEEQFWNDEGTLFIDPPYFKQGKNLYLHYYNEEDHRNLEFLLETLYMGTPCADLIVTYDASPFIESIYEFPDIKRIKRRFSA